MTTDSAARWTAEAQRRQEQGDLVGAIAGWHRALAALPVTQATAHRRAGLTLAIAAAHATLAERGEPERLRVAIATLDAYLAGLDPTDDENRVAVEQRRAELAARPAARPGPTPGDPGTPRRPGRPWTIAGGAAIGLGAAGIGVLAAGLLGGTRADRALAAAVALDGDDERREADKADALAAGLRADRLARAGGIVGGALLLVGVVLVVVGATRKRPPRAAWAPQPGPGGLRWRF